MDILLLFVILALVQVAGWVYSLVDLFQRRDSDVAGDSRVLWAIVIVFVPLAWLVYLLAGRRPRAAM